jgi:hypothetical protein
LDIDKVGEGIVLCLSIRPPLISLAKRRGDEIMPKCKRRGSEQMIKNGVIARR